MFCKNCGKEVLENAFVCPGCGCLVNGNGEKYNIEQEKERLEKKRIVLIKAFLYVSFTLSCLAIFLCSLSIALGYVIIENPSNVKYWKYEDFETEYGWSIVGWIVGALAMGAGIASYFLGRKERGNESQTINTLNLILSISVFVGIFLFWIISVL